MIIGLRRVAGVLLLAGILCLFLNILITDAGYLPEASGTRYPFPDADRIMLGLPLFLIWLMALLGAGLSQAGNYAYSAWMDVLGLIAFVALFTVWFGGVYIVVGQVESLSDALTAYAFNVVPVVQFMVLAVLNPCIEPHQLRAMPR